MDTLEKIKHLKRLIVKVNPGGQAVHYLNKFLTQPNPKKVTITDLPKLNKLYKKYSKRNINQSDPVDMYINLKFKVEGDSNVYTIKPHNNESYLIVWNNNGHKVSTTYSKQQVKKYFNDCSWTRI